MRGRTTSKNNCTLEESCSWSTCKHTNPRKKTLLIASLPLPTPTGQYHSWTTPTAFVCVSNMKWEKHRCSRAKMSMPAWEGEPLLDVKACANNFHHILRKQLNLSQTWIFLVLTTQNTILLICISSVVSPTRMYLFGVWCRRHHRFTA